MKNTVRFAGEIGAILIGAQMVYGATSYLQAFSGYLFMFAVVHFVRVATAPDRF